MNGNVKRKNRRRNRGREDIGPLSFGGGEHLIQILKWTEENSSIWCEMKKKRFKLLSKRVEVFFCVCSKYFFFNL
jgi:hypothetical protein